MEHTMSEKTVFMFPGQGSQYPGMRAKLGELSAGQARLFELADELLDFPLTRLIDEGPEEELTATSNAQPALLVMGIAASMAVEKRGFVPDIVMGHSLGEYTALVYSGAMSFEEGIRLVRTRGLLMANAVDRSPGKMAAVMGADRDRLDELVAEVSKQGVLEITNLNSPLQLVLSGEDHTIDLVVDRVNDEGLGRALLLNVSAPFHSSLMQPMADEFAQHLDKVEIGPPQQLFIDNVTGEPESDPSGIRKKLVQQLTSPVLWERSVRTAHAAGAAAFIECGPRNVLRGLVRRTVRGVSSKTAEMLLAS